MSRQRIAAVLAVLAVSCGKVEGGGRASDAGAGLGTGGQTARTGGTAGTGGTGGVSGAAGTGGAADASGGASTGGAGNACFGADGTLLPSARRCVLDRDCTTLLVPTCCGSDAVVGVASSSACSAPTIDCSGLGCAKFAYPTADDGNTTEDGGAIGVHCRQVASATFECRSFVAPPAGPLPCGTTTCAPDQGCVHPPTSIGGAQPPCMATLEAGACPPGTQWSAYCGGIPGGGCTAIYVPPPPYCVDVPPACGGTPTCACLSTDVCGGGANFCNSVNGRDIECVNLAP